MKLLLDTHAFLWFVWDDPKLSPTARKLIGSGDNEIYLSAVSVWEVSIKVSTGRISVGEDVTVFFTEHSRNNQIIQLPISIAHAGGVSLLPFHHKDPFDRLLVAQSMLEEMPLISADAVIDSYGVSRIW